MESSVEKMEIRDKIDSLKKILFDSCDEDTYLELMLELDLYVREAQFECM